MKKVILCFSNIIIIIIILISCIENSVIEVRAEFKNEEDVIINTPKNIEEFYLFTLQHKLIKLSGIEKLKKLKRLKIIDLPGFTEYSFLNKLPNLEELFIEGPELKDFDFLKYCTKLKVLYVASVDLNKFEIDFRSNTVLEFVRLNNLYNIKKQPFNLVFKNIPKSLRYLDIQLNDELHITRDLLESIAAVEHVFVPSEIKDKFQDFFKTERTNFIFERENSLLPVEYQQKTLSKRTEYRLDYF